MERTLVHICCAPDALYFLKRFREENPELELIGFFYDPNIHPYEEYKLRLIETERTCNKLGIKLIEGEYDLEEWLRSVKGLECEPERGERCSVCFDIRLERSARLAGELGCEAFTTTLLMSPKKKFEQLKESGEKTASRYGVRFLAPNYRKGGGTQEMFRLTKENELYQQDYCGCVHGLINQKGEGSLWDMVSEKGRRPGSKGELLFIKSIRAFAESLGLPTREFEFPFLGWHVLEGGIWVRGEAVPSIIKPYSQSIRGKVRADVERVVGNTLYLNKQFVRLELVEKLRDTPITELAGYTHPTFIVEERFRDLLMNNRIDARLRTKFREEKSSVLLVGNSEAEILLGIPADTLQDCRGFEAEEVYDLLKREAEPIASDRLAMVILGAHSIGRVGQRFFEDLTGRKIGEVLDYR
ncbi:epoxyqueuosine reductase QueH [Hydrogenivirga sp.]